MTREWVWILTAFFLSFMNFKKVIGFYSQIICWLRELTKELNCSKSLVHPLRILFTTIHTYWDIVFNIVNSFNGEKFMLRICFSISCILEGVFFLWIKFVFRLLILIGLVMALWLCMAESTYVGADGYAGMRDLGEEYDGTLCCTVLSTFGFIILLVCQGCHTRVLRTR